MADVSEIKRLPDELEPCPFCGHSCIIDVCQDDSGVPYDIFSVVCSNDECLANGPVAVNAYWAALLWNRALKKKPPGP